MSMPMQAMADFIVAHLGHGDIPAECTPEAQHLMSAAADTARFATPFSAALGEASMCDTGCATSAAACCLRWRQSRPTQHTDLVERKGSRPQAKE